MAASAGVPRWVLLLALALRPLSRRRLPLELIGLLGRSGLPPLALDAGGDAAVAAAAESLLLRRVRPAVTSLLLLLPLAALLPPPLPVVSDAAPLALPARSRSPKREPSADP